MASRKLLQSIRASSRLFSVGRNIFPNMNEVASADISPNVGFPGLTRTARNDNSTSYSFGNIGNEVTSRGYITAVKDDIVPKRSLLVLIPAVNTGKSGCHMSTSSSEGPHSSEGKANIEEEIPEAETVEMPLPERSKLVVLGGNGFVGSAVCKEAISRGLNVLSLNRSGAPGGISDPWVKEVDWVKGDVFETEKWKHILTDTSAVVSCIGAFGTNDFMRKINGEANAIAVKLASAEGVNRFVYVSAHDVGLPSFLLRGYYEGKRTAEAAVQEYFPYGGVILRPGMIHGTRIVGNFRLPLSVIGAPLEAVLKNAKWASQLPVVGHALVPPVKVTAVAKTAIRAATDNAIPPGVLDVWGILRFGGH